MRGSSTAPRLSEFDRNRYSVAALEQRRERARGGERGEDVAVARRRPLERRVGLPRRPARTRRRAASGTLPWTKSSGSPSIAQFRVALQRGKRVVARGEAVHQQERDAPRRAAPRRWSTWRTITSRNVWPSFTSSSDFALVIPMLVPSPPLSLSTTTRSSGRASVRQLVGARNVRQRLQLGLRQGPLRRPRAAGPRNARTCRSRSRAAPRAASCRWPRSPARS